MPAYIHHHEIEMAPIICPSCVGMLPMQVREVEPHWSMTRIDFIYECSDCGTEVRQMLRKPELWASMEGNRSGRQDRQRSSSI
jgi:hypothetical protein